MYIMLGLERGYFSSVQIIQGHSTEKGLDKLHQTCRGGILTHTSEGRDMPTKQRVEVCHISKSEDQLRSQAENELKEA